MPCQKTGLAAGDWLWPCKDASWLNFKEQAGNFACVQEGRPDPPGWCCPTRRPRVVAPSPISELLPPVSSVTANESVVPHENKPGMEQMSQVFLQKSLFQNMLSFLVITLCKLYQLRSWGHTEEGPILFLVAELCLFTVARVWPVWSCQLFSSSWISCDQPPRNFC